MDRFSPWAAQQAAFVAADVSATLALIPTGGSRLALFDQGQTIMHGAPSCTFRCKFAPRWCFIPAAWRGAWMDERI